MSDVFLGIDLGGTFVKVAAVSRDERILAKLSLPSHADAGVDGVLEGMVTAADQVLASAGLSRRDVLAAGIGAPGPMNWQTGVVFEPPNLPGWRNVPLADLMTKRLGVPCFVENDANAACYGEYWLGAGQGAENMCLLTLGTGLGGGIVVFKKLLRGVDGTAGEIGHMCVKRDGRPCNCGSRGCLETYASVTGMVRTAVKGLRDGRESSLRDACGGDFDKVTGKMISEAADQGDAFARWVISETGVWLGVGIATLINLFNPEKVVLCGGMISAGERLFQPIRDTARAMAFGVPAARAQIVPAGLGLDSGVIGAAGCALARLEHGA